MPLDSRSPAHLRPGHAHSVCPHDCPSTCVLDVQRLSPQRIGAVHGAATPYTDGVICAKVARYAERAHHPDRLTQPLRRTGPKGSGQFSPISWDDALDEIARRFQQVTASHGAEAVWPYYYAGTMGYVQRDGINRLRHVMGYSRQKTTICTRAAESGWMVGVGTKNGTDPRELADSDLIVIWGGNPVATQVHVMTHAAKARKQRGARIVVIDPYRSPTAAAADLHLALRPGTDGALACAVMHVAFRDDLADLDYLERHTDFPRTLRSHLASRSPAWAAAITGLSVEAIEAFARLYLTTPRSYLRVGYGFSRSANGPANLHAVTCLPAISGAWRHRGGGAMWALSGPLFHLDKNLIEGTDQPNPSARTLDMSRIGAVLTGDPRDLGAGPPVLAMLIQNTNPMAVAPAGAKVAAGFARDDLFVAVHEQFLTETARQADIVLPATSFLEHDDLYTASGSGFLQAARAVIEPWGESRSNHAVICALAERLGAAHRGFQMSAWELVDATLAASDWPTADALLAQRTLDVNPGSEANRFADGFGFPDGKFRFAADWAAIGPDWQGMPTLPDHHDVIQAADADHPFRLITPPARQFLNSTFSETEGSRKRERRPEVKLHPQDLAKLGIAAGALVALGNRQGEVHVHAASFDGLQPGVAVVEGIWPNSAYANGWGINILVSDEPVRPAGGAAFHDIAVWIRPVA